MNKVTSMKPTKTFVLVVLLSAVGLPSAAIAAVFDHSGTICRNFWKNQADDIEYLARGVRTQTAVSDTRQVICPIVRWAGNFDSVTIYIDVFHDIAPMETPCTVFNYDWNGTLLSQQSVTLSGFGSVEGSITLPAVPLWSNLSVLCTLPANGHGVLLDLDVNDITP